MSNEATPGKNDQETVTTLETETTDFNAAFDEAAKKKEGKAKTTDTAEATGDNPDDAAAGDEGGDKGEGGDKPAGDKGGDTSGDKPDDKSAAKPGDKPAEAAAGADGDGKGGDAPPDYKALYEQTHNELQQVKHKTSSWEGRLSKAAADNKKLQEQLDKVQADLKKVTEKPAPAQADTELELSADDQAALSEVEKDYPVIGRAIEARAKQMAKQIIAKTKPAEPAPAALPPETAQRIEKLETQVAGIEQRSMEDHFAMIRRSHGDFDDIVAKPDLMAWIEEQPFKVAQKYKQVHEGGTAEQVIELVDQYKTARGLKPKPKGDPNPNPNPNPAANANDRRAAQARAAEAVPRRSSPAPRGQANAEDYDGAWEEAARKKTANAR